MGGLPHAHQIFYRNKKHHEKITLDFFRFLPFYIRFYFPHIEPRRSQAIISHLDRQPRCVVRFYCPDIDDRGGRGGGLFECDGLAGAR